MTNTDGAAWMASTPTELIARAIGVLSPSGLSGLMSRLGLVGLAGIALLAGSAWVNWRWLPQQDRDTAQLASQARGLRHALLADTQPQTGQRERITRPDQAWQIVWSSLPKADQRTALQAAVLKAARAQGLQPPAVQYQGQREAWAHQGDETLWREHMTMPVQGPYAAVQAWVQDVLREPALSVDALSIQRDSASSDTVSAQLSVSLWWRQPWQAPPEVRR